MRKFIIFALTAILSVSLTSCEEDPDEFIAYSLEGTWAGYMYNPVTDERIFSTIEFIGDPYNARYGATGTGRWLDDYPDGDYFYSRIEWKVTYENIEIYLLDNSADDRRNILYIDRNTYRLSTRYFSGVLAYFGGQREFNLVKVDAPDWSRYPYGYSKKAN
ncbi:MAG: hypothetical protein NC344_03020 [Bacteroidales bacterium]|nr:hypothetical protein [Bacteroidales bacterium]MCM1146803.1 hypothetical protein [Bacteroidales bacterium]MCM1205699.1 hypothetical protein [Bacillota bacterium]MCM1510771.1 hypothetical protein [Clostridium sp.]